MPPKAAVMLGKWYPIGTYETWINDEDFGKAINEFLREHGHIDNPLTKYGEYPQFRLEFEAPDKVDD